MLCSKNWQAWVIKRWNRKERNKERWDPTLTDLSDKWQILIFIYWSSDHRLMLRGACGFSPEGIWGCRGTCDIYIEAGNLTVGPFLWGLRGHIRCVGHMTCLRTEPVKPTQQLNAAWLGKDQWCSFMPGLGSTRLWGNLWSSHAETNRDSSQSRAIIHLQTVWGRVSVLSAAIWASVIRNGLRTNEGASGRRGCTCPAPLLWDLLCQALGKHWTRASLLLSLCSFKGQKGLPCTFLSNQGEGRTNQILGRHLMTFYSRYSVCLDATDSMIVSGGWQEPLIETACVSSNKLEVDFTFATFITSVQILTQCMSPVQIFTPCKEVTGWLLFGCYLFPDIFPNISCFK